MTRRPLTPAERAQAYAVMRRYRIARIIEQEGRPPETEFSPLWVQRFDRWRMV